MAQREPSTVRWKGMPVKEGETDSGFQINFLFGTSGMLHGNPIHHENSFFPRRKGRSKCKNLRETAENYGPHYPQPGGPSKYISKREKTLFSHLFPLISDFYKVCPQLI